MLGSLHHCLVWEEGLRCRIYKVIPGTRRLENAACIYPAAWGKADQPSSLSPVSRTEVLRCWCSTFPAVLPCFGPRIRSLRGIRVRPRPATFTAVPEYQTNSIQVFVVCRRLRQIRSRSDPIRSGPPHLETTHTFTHFSRSVSNTLVTARLGSH